jgi:hypothetical protein
MVIKQRLYTSDETKKEATTKPNLSLWRHAKYYFFLSPVMDLCFFGSFLMGVKTGVLDMNSFGVVSEQVVSKFSISITTAAKFCAICYADEFNITSS